jgi:hypothetical protein
MNRYRTAVLAVSSSFLLNKAGEPSSVWLWSFIL